MSSATIVLPYECPNLNDLVRLKAGSHHGYNKVKKLWAKRVAECVDMAFTPSFPSGAHVTLCIVEKTRRRDPDNLCSGAAKLILDGLVSCGVLPGDGWYGVKSLSFEWRTGTPCVSVELRS